MATGDSEFDLPGHDHRGNGTWILDGRPDSDIRWDGINEKLDKIAELLQAILATLAVQNLTVVPNPHVESEEVERGQDAGTGGQ